MKYFINTGECGYNYRGKKLRNAYIIVYDDCFDKRIHCNIEEFSSLFLCMRNSVSTLLIYGRLKFPYEFKIPSGRVLPSLFMSIIIAKNDL